MKCNRNEVRELYLTGLPTRSVAQHFNISSSYVAYICKDILRPKRGLRQQYHKEHVGWRQYRFRARALMETYLGRQLDTKEHVHHKNNDFTDNRLENLEVLSEAAHHSLHNKRYDVPKWKRPERILYMKAYLKAWRERQKHGKELPTTTS